MRQIPCVVLAPEDPAGRALRTALSNLAELQVLAVAAAPLGSALVTKHAPAVVLLVYDGSASALGAIDEIMSGCPTPILLLRQAGVDVQAAARGLDAGAVDVAPCPIPGDALGLGGLVARIRLVSGIQVIRQVRGRRAARAGGSPVVAIGASTGGPQAVADVLRKLAGVAAPVLVVQHLHPAFMERFRDWMGRESVLPVEIAVHGADALPGVVYLAPSGAHLMLGPARRLLLSTTPDILHRPSADILFQSIAEHAGPAGVGVLLTGMGDDGAAGLLAILQSGGRTIVQNEASSAVYGMARAAQTLGAAEQVLGLDRIAEAVLSATAVPV